MWSYIFEQQRYMGFFGIAAVLLVAFFFSHKRSRIHWKLVINGLLLQFALAFFILKTSIGLRVFEYIALVFTRLYGFADKGTSFVFGRLADPSGPWAMVFAIKVVPIIIFFGALMSLLFHLGVIQKAVRGIAIVIRPLFGTTGAETLCAVANSMLGQTEAPLLIKHYLHTMTSSEIFVVMVSGFATLSGALLAVYGSLGVPMLHLLSASVMAVPGALLISKMLMPETEHAKTMKNDSLVLESESKNILDAISSGTTDGMHLAANVVAMLIAFISLIALVNFCFKAVGFYSLKKIFGFIFGPVALLIGIPRAEMEIAGSLLGKKLVVNEFVAFTAMLKESLSARTVIILTYALAGFSNFSCIGIQIGGIGALAPQKRDELTRLGLRALLGGTLANFLNAAIASLFI